MSTELEVGEYPWSESSAALIKASFVRYLSNVCRKEDSGKGDKLVGISPLIHSVDNSAIASMAVTIVIWVLEESAKEMGVAATASDCGTLLGSFESDMTE
jgi:hypothetical protein